MNSYCEDETISIKLKLIECIRDMVTQKGWTQTEAAKNLDISRSRFCRVMGGQTKDISEWRLMQCLAMLGNDIKIFIVPTQNSQGKIEIVDINVPPKKGQTAC
ncbi:XRE family transcriptional regulator [Acidithiobacillus thiooxidans]|uniref:helix-turn-helix domain-containing protein n=1 Tax=Acidithiobacillus thiooxidans TaxID=930 RepID=UPI0004E1A759|nr:XRE family transcriptional regulator [Acidithiobacillus thiooxidans]MBU2840913.1 XRE family transcriptional regulator [Acidithiobacillus thiooxidans]